jgi:hypothetical protein
MGRLEKILKLNGVYLKNAKTISFLRKENERIHKKLKKLGVMNEYE